MALWTEVSTPFMIGITKISDKSHFLSWFQHHTATTLTIAAALLPGIATLFLVSVTKAEGKRNHESNRHMIESNRHLINLQYRANAYKNVVQFIAETRYQMRKRLKSLQERIADQTHDHPQPPEVNREELSVFVTLELHASSEALEVYFNWDDKLTICSNLFDKLIKRDQSLEFKDLSETSRIEDLNTIASQMSELYRLEKAFLETVKREVAL